MKKLKLYRRITPRLIQVQKVKAWLNKMKRLDKKKLKSKLY